MKHFKFQFSKRKLSQRDGSNPQWFWAVDNLCDPGSPPLGFGKTKYEAIEAYFAMHPEHEIKIECVDSVVLRS